jgi:hypothetical protein
MFHGKFVIVAEVQLVTKTQIVTINVNVVDVYVTTRSKANKERVQGSLRKGKNVVDWEKKRLKKSMVETIQQIQKNINLNKRAIHIHRGMEHNLAGYAKYYSCGSIKISRSNVFNRKFDYNKRYF